MYATIRRYRLKSGDMHEMMHEVDSGFAPIVEKIDGFCAYEALDCGDNVLITISTFRDRSSAEESTEAASNWIRDNVEGRFEMERLDVTTGEVSVSRAKEEMLQPAHA